MKKLNTPKTALKLQTQTIATLAADKLDAVAGGMIRPTRQSDCDSACVGKTC